MLEKPKKIKPSFLWLSCGLNLSPFRRTATTRLFSSFQVNPGWFFLERIFIIVEFDRSERYPSPRIFMQIMGRSPFLSLLIVLVSLVLLLSPGSSRKIMEIVQREDFAARAMQESAEKFREMIEVMDYSDPEPNTNVRGGIISPPPPEA